MNTRNYLQTILGILLMGCAFSASSQDYWVDIGSVEAEEQDGVVLVPVRINKITDQGFTVPGEVGSGDNVRVWYATSPFVGGGINTVAGEDYEDKSGWIRFREGDSEKFISITLISDDKHESDETIIIDLSFAKDAEQATSADGKSAFQSSQGHVFIRNNDCSDKTIRPNCVPPVATAPDVEADEGTDLEISVTLNLPVRADISYPYEIHLASDNTNVDLAHQGDFVDNPALSGHITVPAGTTKGSLKLPLKKGDGYEKRKETFTVTIRGPTLADGDVTASIVNVDECVRGIDDSDGTGDSGICRPYPEVILGHHTKSVERVEGKDQRFGGRGVRNTGPTVSESKCGDQTLQEPCYFDEVWDAPLKVNWRLVSDTAMVDVDYTGPEGHESGILEIQNPELTYEEDVPFWESNAFSIPTVNRRGVQGPRTFHVEVTPHPDNPGLLFIIPDEKYNGPTDYSFWDFDQTTDCAYPCQIPITFDDDGSNLFPGVVKLVSPGMHPEFLGVVHVGAQIDELRTENYDQLEVDEDDGSRRYTPVRVQTFETGTDVGYATGGVDYTAIDIERRMYVNDGAILFPITITSNDGLEGDEEFGFRVTLVNYDDPPLEGTVLILDNEIESGAYISIYTAGGHYDADEGSRIEVQFQITGDPQNDRTYEVEVFTELLGNGTGYANNADFIHKSQTFTVTGNDDRENTSFFVATLEDRLAEPAEKFGVVLRLKNAPDIATRSAAVTVTINASDYQKPLNIENVDGVACTLPNSICAVGDEMIGQITAVTQTEGGLERLVYVDAIAGGNCCQKCAGDSIPGTNVIVETQPDHLWGSGVTGGIVDADVGEYLRTLHQYTDDTDSCTITYGVQLTYPYEDQPLYILDLDPEEVSVTEGGVIVLTATLDPAQDKALEYYLVSEVPHPQCNRQNQDPPQQPTNRPCTIEAPLVAPAKIHSDFEDPLSHNFEFPKWRTEMDHTVRILVDDLDEPKETFSVRLGKDGVSFPAVYSIITIINDPANGALSSARGAGVENVSGTVFVYTDNVDGFSYWERANLAGQYEFLINDTSRPKGSSGRYSKLRVSDWYTVTSEADAFALNVEDGNGASLDCPIDLVSGSQNAEFNWGDGNSVGYYVYGAFVSNNGARCVFEASPSGHTGDPGQVPSGAVTVTFTPAID